MLIVAIIKAFDGWLNKKEYTGTDNKLSLITLIVVHTQFLVGLVIYFISPLVQRALSDMGAAMKETTLRFWAVEHIAMMLVAVVLITIGRSSSKKAVDAVIKHKRIALFFLIGLIIILAAIPWPFSRVPRPWF
jgi:hypothetical protein